MVWVLSVEHGPTQMEAGTRVMINDSSSSATTEETQTRPREERPLQTPAEKRGGTRANMPPFSVLTGARAHCVLKWWTGERGGYLQPLQVHEREREWAGGWCLCVRVSV